MRKSPTSKGSRVVVFTWCAHLTVNFYSFESPSLITSGICTTIQILHTKIYKTKYYLGSGMLCVIATSFAFLPTAQQTIRICLREGLTYDEAYGSLLGVFMVGAIFQSLFSFIPSHYLRRIFPTWLAGLGVFLIGVNLLGVGVQQWGGGGQCLASGEGCAVGDSDLPFGSGEYLGLGFLVMTLILVFELFGSPFMRSCGIAFALLIGYVVAMFTTDRNGDSYSNTTAISEAPSVLFLWTKTFPIGFYTPALLPTLIGYVVSTIETYGDSTATAQYSGLKPHTQEYDEAIQGGLLGDSVNSFISALSLVLPSTTASPNIGVISLTKVSSRDAGYGCAAWMFIYGVFGKVGAFFTSIPSPVLGGMSTFLFANIAVSGLQVMTSHGVDRRSRFIMSVSFCFGLGGILIPQFFGSGNFFDCQSIESPGSRGVCDAAEITLSTGYAVGCLVAVLLNAIMPEEVDDEFASDAEAGELMVDTTIKDDSRKTASASSADGSAEDASSEENV